jgi:hypothetical protein
MFRGPGVQISKIVLRCGSRVRGGRPIVCVTMVGERGGELVLMYGDGDGDFGVSYLRLDGRLISDRRIRWKRGNSLMMLTCDN